jgi:hypothetical protein
MTYRGLSYRGMNHRGMPGDRILTSDPDDLTRLAAAAANGAVIIAC